MSYDLAVYGGEALDKARLVALVGSVSSLAVADGSSGSTTTVTRGAKQQYSFTVEGPHHVELEDLPEEVSAVALAPEWLYEIHGEGTSAAEIPHAIRFARALGKAIGGVAVDLQTDQVWAVGGARSAPRSQAERIPLVELRWHFIAGEPIGHHFLTLAKRFLPELLPRRFGAFEPMNGSLERDGERAFLSALSVETIHTSGKFPSHGAYFGHAEPGSSATIATSFDAATLTDPRWRASLEGFFIGLARAADCYYADAEVIRDVIWTGRSIQHDSTSEHQAKMTDRSGWLGLPPYPVWWSYFGPDYAPLVAERLAGDVATHGSGVFQRLSEFPLDRDALLAQLAGATSVPPELQMTYVSPDGKMHWWPPVNRAALVPQFAGQTSSD